MKEDPTITILLLNQMKLRDLNKMHGSGYYEALNLAKKIDKIIFLAYTTQKRLLKRKVKKNFIIYAYPFQISFKNIMLDVLKTIKNIIETTVFIVKLIKRHKISLLRAEGIILWGIVSFLVKKITGIPYAIYIVGDTIQAINEKYESKIMKLVSKVLEVTFKPIYREAKSISTNLISEYVKLKRENKKVLFLPTRIDIRKFKCKGKPFEGDIISIMYVGRLDKEKGVHLLIKALRDKRLNNIIYKIYIIGHGPLEKEIIRLAKEDVRIEYIGVVDNKEMPKWYNKVDAIIVPSLTEGMPAVVLEALACQRLVIATSVGSIPFVLANGKYGILINPGDIEDIIAAIINITQENNREKFKEMAKRGRKRARALIKLYEKNIIESLTK